MASSFFIGVIVLLMAGCARPVPDAELPTDSADAVADGTEDSDDGGTDAPVEATYRLPSVEGTDSDCEPLNMVDSVPLGSWMEVADGVVFGTVTAFRPVDSPCGSVGTTGVVSGTIDPAACTSMNYAMDVDLTDLTWLGDPALAQTTTVRIGAGTWTWWSSFPRVSDDGRLVEQWNLDGVISESGPIAVGMRLGGAVYSDENSPYPVWASAAREPLFEVVDGVVHMQQVDPAECGYPALESAPLDGMTEAALLAALASPGDASAEATADYSEMMLSWQEWVKFSAAFCNFVGDAYEE